MSEEQELEAVAQQELATLEAQMEAEAKEMQNNLTITTSKISTKGKQFTMPDGTAAGLELEAVVLGWVHANAFYPGIYDPNNITAPVCFAIGMPGTDLAPGEEVEKPENDVCEGCPNNEYKSGANGKGKACKNEIKVAVIVPKYSDKPMTLSISPLGLRPFNEFMGGVLKAYSHPARAIVTVGFSKDAFPVVEFRGGGVPNPQALLHYAKASEAIKNILETKY